MGEWFEDESFWSELYTFMFSEERFQLAGEQIEKILALVDYRGGDVLDLCCGPGRHAVALAKRGIRVTAVDRSEFLLNNAKAEAAKANLEIEFILDDMRRFVRSSSFSLILNMFTSFGYFENIEDDLTVLRNAYQSLKTEGAMLIDLLGKEVLARKFQPTNSSEGGDGTLLIERHEICEDWTHCRNQWLLVKEGTVRPFFFKTRLYSGYELKDLMQRAGFEEVSVYGDLAGKEYGINADRLIAIGRKMRHFT